MADEQHQLLINRNDLDDVHWSASPLPELTAGEVLFEVESFALTANNITYAVAGDSMKYWQFFPAEPGWGRLPVWGFGRVVASAHPDVSIGERYYGYFPAGSHLKIKAEKAGRSGLVDAAEHRVGLAVVYNQYVRAGEADESGDGRGEAAEMLYRPLYMTSFLIADFFEENGFFGASQMLLTSASSKTAIGLAFLLARMEGVEVIGLTSPGNTAFVSSLGCYDQVLGYNALAGLDGDVPSAVVDMAGNGAVLADVHQHFDAALKYSCLVGATHWDARSGAQDLPGPSPVLFFAPDRIAQRTKDWGPGGLQERFQSAWGDFLEQADGWINVSRERGTEVIEARYREQLAGTVSPQLGLILSVR